jgi:hypothetical protein
MGASAASRIQVSVGLPSLSWMSVPLMCTIVALHRAAPRESGWLEVGCNRIVSPQRLGSSAAGVPVSLSGWVPAMASLHASNLSSWQQAGAVCEQAGIKRCWP